MNTDIAPAGDEDYEMPCAEALLAGTLALMTGHAQACCEEHRTRIAHKVTENLARLSEHALLSPQFRTLLWGLTGRWQSLQAAQAASPAPAERDHRLWHGTPDAVQ